MSHPDRLSYQQRVNLLAKKTAATKEIARLNNTLTKIGASIEQLADERAAADDALIVDQAIGQSWIGLARQWELTSAGAKKTVVNARRRHNARKNRK